MLDKLKILPVALMEQYMKQVPLQTGMAFELLHDSPLSADNFSFYTSVSAVFSSKIEGEDIELDSFIKHKKWGTPFQPDYTRKIDDLYDAYIFAQQTKLAEDSLHKAHAILTRHILSPLAQGAIRKRNMYVPSDEGMIDYVAAMPHTVRPALSALFDDIAFLIKAQLEFRQVLFFASLIHLVFVKIHPYEDGNGRSARLLEKWFMAEKLGAKSWLAQSEKYYYTHHQTYYNNLRILGLEYDVLDYTKALPFLLMLRDAVNIPPLS